MEQRELTAPCLTRFDRAAFGAVAGLLAIVFAYLLAYGLLRTSVFDPADPAGEHVLYVWDNVAVNLAMLLGWLVLFRLALHFQRRIRLGWLTGAALGVTFALGVAWVLVLRAVPVNDPGILYYTAAELTRGDPSELWRHEVYLRTNPFQAGYLQYSELLQRIFGRHSYVPQGLLNAAFLTAAYGALMDLTWRSLHDRRTQVALTLLLVLCVQPMCYTTFLYGNLPGLCLSLWALDCLLRWLTGGRRRWIVPALTLMALAVVLKPNYLIFALAAALVTALYALGSRRLGALLVCAGLLAAPMAADRLEMTPGSLWMIHDPSVMAWGNERDLEEAVRLLKAYKESILNVYGRRCRKARDEIGAMMRDTTWMDAGQALQDGFIDGIADLGGGVLDAACCHEASLAEAKEKVQNWLDRWRPARGASAAQAPQSPGTPVIQLQKRLALITPTKR